MHLNLAMSECLAAFLLTGAEAFSAPDLKVWSQPVSEVAYETIDLASVRFEPLEPDGEWVYRVNQLNPMIGEMISVHPVASIDIRFREPEDVMDSAKSYGPLVEAGRKCAAGFGANVLYLNHSLMNEGRFAGLHFIAYRAQYNELLIPPALLDALTQTTLYDNAFIQEAQVWNDIHFGKVKVSEAKVVDFLKQVKDGASVRLVLEDGSDINGTFSGIDADEDIWIRPEGIVGVFMDHSFHPKEVHSVGLLN